MQYSNLIRDKRVIVASSTLAVGVGGALIFYVIRKKRKNKSFGPEQLSLLDDKNKIITYEDIINRSQRKETVSPTGPDTPGVVIVKEEVHPGGLIVEEWEELEEPDETYSNLSTSPDDDEEDEENEENTEDDEEDEEEIEEIKPNVYNIFESRVGQWDHEAELSSRDPEKPYIIHQSEYLEHDSGLKQETLTYYAGDNILVDSHDEIIPRHERLVGDLKFGHGSNDRDVVYVRNETKNREWEIVFNPSTYSLEVLGIEYDEPPISVPKFREE